MRSYTYTISEDGYVYHTGTVRAATASDALDLACEIAAPADRTCYMPDDGSTIRIDQWVRVGELSRRVTFEV